MTPPYFHIIRRFTSNGPTSQWIHQYQLLFQKEIVSMQWIEKNICSSAPCQILIWKRLTDDIISIVHKVEIGALTHLNGINPHNKFTEETKENWCLPYNYLFEVLIIYSRCTEKTPIRVTASSKAIIITIPIHRKDLWCLRYFRDQWNFLMQILFKMNTISHKPN